MASCTCLQTQAASPWGFVQGLGIMTRCSERLRYTDGDLQEGLAKLQGRKKVRAN